MATTWVEDATEILRILINDFSNTPTYTDNTLEQLLVVAARYVVQEVKLGTTYTITYSTGDISPDPSSDTDFVNFMVLKAACMINKWKFDDMAIIQGIRAKLGPAEMGVDAAPTSLITFLEEGPCKTYDQLKNEYNFGRIGAIRGIFSPFVSNKYWPENNALGRSY